MKLAFPLFHTENRYCKCRFTKQYILLTLEFPSGYNNLVVFSSLCYLRSIVHVLLVEVDSY